MTSAPELSSILSIASWPCQAAWCKGVQPCTTCRQLYISRVLESFTPFLNISLFQWCCNGGAHQPSSQCSRTGSKLQQDSSFLQQNAITTRALCWRLSMYVLSIESKHCCSFCYNCAYCTCRICMFATKVMACLRQISDLGVGRIDVGSVVQQSPECVLLPKLNSQMQRGHSL